MKHGNKIKEQLGKNSCVIKLWNDNGNEFLPISELINISFLLIV